MLQHNDEISVIVTAGKMVVLDNQQPSPDEGKVQRLSGSAEYGQVAGSGGQPCVHKCKDCGEDDILMFGIRANNGKPYNYCRKCRQARNIETQRRYSQRPYVREKKRACDVEYAQKNAEKIAAYQKKYRENNRSHLIAQTRKRYQMTRERHLEKCREWKKGNKGRVNATCAKRHAEKMKRVPKWHTELDDLILVEIYNLCRMRTEATGIPHHVDHIYPLMGETVSGLHTPCNLRVITASENCRKGNKVEDIVCSAWK